MLKDYLVKERESVLQEMVQRTVFKAPGVQVASMLEDWYQNVATKGIIQHQITVFIDMKISFRITDISSYVCITYGNPLEHAIIILHTLYS